MNVRRSIYWSLVVLLLVVVAESSPAQMNGNSSEWESLSPAAEEFTIEMPKNSTITTGTFSYHKMELNTRLYLSTSAAGPVLAVVSFSGIKSNPALYSDFQRFNSYVDAFKNWFPSKVSGKEIASKLTPLGNTTFHGYAGREYQLTVGDLSGVAQTYVTRKRFYAVVVLNTKKDDSLQKRFLSSFVLPDRPPDPPPAVAQKNEASRAETTASGTRPSRPGDGARPDAEAENAPPKPEANDANSTPPGKKGPISGGVLNSKAIYLPIPERPPGDVVGLVTVQVTIDEQGNVVEARASSGPNSLQAAAVNAARLAKFSPTTLMGEPVKVTGILMYNFTR